MGQQEILKYLIRRPKQEISITELAIKLNIDKTNIARACRRMKDREIKIRRVKEGPFTRFLISAR